LLPGEKSACNKSYWESIKDQTLRTEAETGRGILANSVAENARSAQIPPKILTGWLTGQAGINDRFGTTLIWEAVTPHFPMRRE